MVSISRLKALMTGDSLKSQVMRSSSWTMVGFGASYAIRLGSTLILTRLLTPDVFGLMALAGVFMVAVQMFSDLGTGPSVVRSTRGDETPFLQTAWTVQAIRGVGICVIVSMLAWPVSQIYDQPVLFPLICALSFSAILDGLVSVAVLRAKRHMQLGRLTLLDLTVQVGATATNVLAAWMLQSVWALVIGGIIGSTLRLTLSHWILPSFSHRFLLERETLREIVSFGRWLILATLFTYLGGRGIQAIMGGLVEIETLGLITLATTIAWALGELIQKVLGNAVFPSLSKIHRERPHELRAAVGKVKRLITFTILPLFVLIAYLGQPLVDLLYDPRYAGVGPMLSLFALNGAIAVISMPYQNLVLATGDGQYHAQFMFVATATRIAGLAAGFYMGGLYGMITGLGVGTVAVIGVSTWWAYRRGISYAAYDIFPLAAIMLVYAGFLISFMGTA